MAGDEDAALCVVPMSQRKAKGGSGAECGGDAGDDVDGNAGRLQDVDFLAAAPEDEGVTAFQTHHGFTRSGQVDQQLTDVFLRQGVVARHLADEDAFGAGSGEVDDAVAGLSQLLEPMIMVFLGVVIGGLVVAMYLPIFKIGAVVG